MNICSSCGQGLLAPKITSSPFMIMKENVTLTEMGTTVFATSARNQYGRVENTNSYYLNIELGRVGLQLPSFTLSCLYMHKPPKGKTKVEREVTEKCYDASLANLIEIAKDKKIILVMGAGLIKTITGYNASSVYGLVCKSELLPNVPVIIPAPNSDLIMRQPIGEFRFAIKTLAEQIDIYKQYMSGG